MSPSATSTSVQEEKKNGGVSYDINLPYKPPAEADLDKAKSRTEFPGYLPTWDKIWFEECPPFEFEDPALRASRDKPHLIRAGVEISHITPKMGSVLTGVKLEKLDDSAKNELALLIAERKIVVFRDQKDFLETGPGFQQDFMRYFGKPNYQPITGIVKGYPGFHIIHRDNNQDEMAKFFEHKTTSTLWHQDVSYERQPPGYIMLGILACPDVGGDTVFADTVEAYNRLSPAFQSFLDKLQAVHTSSKIIGFARENGGLVRKDPIDSVHPVVRVHPVTGERAIFLNAEFVTSIAGLKDKEYELLMKFLIDHIQTGHDFQCRVRWERHSVVMFDGRTTLHTATVDYDSSKQARHIFRLASMTEKPIPVQEH